MLYLDFFMSCSLMNNVSLISQTQGYIAYMRSLPINDTPEIFGLHENANITFAQNETLNMLSSLMALQPKSASGGGKSREEVCNIMCLCICFSWSLALLSYNFIS